MLKIRNFKRKGIILIEILCFNTVKRLAIQGTYNKFGN